MLQIDFDSDFSSKFNKILDSFDVFVKVLKFIFHSVLEEGYPSNSFFGQIEYCAMAALGRES